MSLSHTSHDVKPLTSLEKLQDSKEKTPKQLPNDKPQGFFANYEHLWGEGMKNHLHYKFFGRPIYKMLGGNKYPLLSVPFTFAAMDYVFHQVLPRLLAKRELSSDILKLDMYATCFWVSLGLPIAFYKHYKNNQEFFHQEMSQDEKYHCNNIRSRMI